ncbi:MAG: hypothetical protein WCO07_01350 [bacterium]
MALTANQITDVFQKQVGRAPTPYEISKYSTASIQDLTGLKTTYSSYKPDQSVVDYLAYQGQDPSIKARSELASKYGISGYTGAYDQNVALLKSLKGGAPTTPSVDGSVAGAGLTSADPTKTIPESATPPALTGTIPGSTDITTTSPVSKTPPVNPDVQTSLDAYNTSQKAVLDVTSRIDSINKAIDSALQNKRDEIARSGGVVDESQLRSLVLTESAPLLQERKDLLATRTQLVGEQNIASKAYQDALNRQKQDEANYYKQQSLDISQEKVDVQQSQFVQKLEQSGWKSSKVNVYDPAGNVIGQKVVWSENPSTASDNKAQTVTTSSGSGGISKNGTTNVGNTATLPKIDLTEGTPAQVLQTLISGKPVYVKGITTPISQQDLYNSAILDMLGSTSSAGGRTPSAEIPAIKDKETQIMNAYGLTPFDVAIARNEFKNMTSANLQLLQTSAFIHTYGSTAVDNLNLALEQSKLVPRGGAKMANNFKQWMQGNWTPAGDLAKFETYIYTAGREYAKVTSGGAKSAQALTDSAQAEVEKLINASQAPEVFAQVVQAMEADMNNVISNFDKQTSSYPEKVKALFGMASANPTLMRSSVPDDKTFVEKSLVRQGFHYDTLMKEMNASIPPGTQPALDNSTGKPVYATQDDIKNGLATPL